MYYKKLLCIAFAVLWIFTTEASTNKSYPTWIENAVFYQIYPQSFKDSNGDGIGDLQGIIEKLPYIKSLDVDAIWLNPFFSSTFMDAGYDVTDFYQVAPRYGTNVDLEELTTKAHALGIKVVFDLVAGHSSIEHPWFKASAQIEKNEYSERYIWTNSKSIQPKDFVKREDLLRDGTYQKNFFPTQAALNYGYANPNPNNNWEIATNSKGAIATREAMKELMAFWMNKGADGFRVDMASSLVKNDAAFTETFKLWGNIRQWFSGKYPEGILVSEWSNPTQAIKAGFMIDFMIHFGVKGYPSLFFENKNVTLPLCENPFFAKEGKGNIMEFLNSYTEQQNGIGKRGMIALPTANHDFQRLRAGTRQTTEELKVALAFLFTFKSVPFLYYGDEIGMKYNSDSLPNKEGSVIPPDFVNGIYANRAGTRTPMQWNSERNAGFSSATIDKLYLPIDTDINRPTVESQENDTHSLLNFVRQLIQLKKKNPALSKPAKLSVVFAKKNTYPFIYIRQSGKNAVLVCLNPKDKAVSVEFILPINADLTPALVQNMELKKLPNGKYKVIMKGVSFGVYQL